MKRLAALLLGLMLLGGTAPVAAAVDDYYWSDSFGGWVDSACATSGWAIEVFDDANYGGGRARICSPEPNFCYVPLYRSHGSDCWGKGMANDNITAFKVTKKPAGYHPQAYWNANYGAPAYWASGNVPNIGSTWNDTWSAIKLVVNT